MSSKVEKILGQAVNFEKIANESLVSEAKKKEKKVDPKAKVRNRGTVCVPAESAKDKKDHFPINDEGQARNALARVHQYSSVPEWYSGSLKSLQDLVARKVKAKYPKIDVGGKDSKKKSAYYDALLTKLAQGAPKDMENAKNLTSSRLQSIEAVNSRNNLTPDQVKEYVQGYLNQAHSDFMGNMITNEQYTQLVQAGQRKMHGTDTTQGPVPINWNANQTYTPQQLPNAKPVAPARRPIAHRSDVENAQRALNNLKSYNKIEFDSMLDPDGKLGPLTQKALKAYKSYVGIPSLSDEQAIKALNTKREETSTGPSVKDQYEAGTLQTLTPAKS